MVVRVTRRQTGIHTKLVRDSESQAVNFDDQSHFLISFIFLLDSKALEPYELAFYFQLYHLVADV